MHLQVRMGGQRRVYGDSGFPEMAKPTALNFSRIVSQVWRNHFVMWEIIFVVKNTDLLELHFVQIPESDL